LNGFIQRIRLSWLKRSQGIKIVINHGLAVLATKRAMKTFFRNIFVDIHRRICPIIMAMTAGQMPNHLSMGADGFFVTANLKFSFLEAKQNPIIKS